ncbi:MAG: hypothetical protein EA403_07010 [Spirochaetaceae bacterium]|nr:MAG: hypothetical protein EA403_07010 [Spirochaetaceae bacterium]
MARISLFCACAVLLTACRPESESMIRQLSELESPRYDGGEIPDERIRELREGIRLHQEQIRATVQSARQLSVYHRMLAIEYINRSMYGLALEELDRAIRIEPENPQLFYYAGVSAARFAKAMVDSGERERYLSRAEAFYLRAIELDSRHVNSLYGLAVLYSFEMDRPEEAEPLLTRILDRQARNVQAMALLARVYATTDRLEEAARMYTQLADITGDPDIRREALRNRDLVREAMR